MKIKKKQKKSKIIEIKYKNEKKINIIVTCIILIIIYIPFYLMQEEKKYLKRKFILENEITIKIVGNGTKKILDGDFPAIPSEVNINGVKQDSAGKSINIEGDQDQETVVTMKFNSPLTTTAKMFFYLKHVIEIDLSKFDFSSVKNMGGMFRECSSLTSINFGNCDTSSVTLMTGLFQECTKLISLDLSNFNTSNVENMEVMFYHCAKLKSVNLGSFNTIKVNNMNSMFYQCESLTTLDLSSFDTSNVVNMQSTFALCNSLISLNLDNFNTSKVTIMSLMFYKCSSLISLNINSFDTSSVPSSHDIFTNVPNDLIFCSEPSKLTSISTEISTYTNNCDNVCFNGGNTKIFVQNRVCTLDCKTDVNYQYEYNNICFTTCPNDTHYSYDNMFLCQKEPEGYFLDEYNIYKQCYKTCKFCYGEGDADNHNCIMCKLNFRKIDEIGKENNCYSECDYYYYFDSSGNYGCSNDNSCPIYYNKLINEKNKCIDECKNDDTYQYEFNGICYNSTCPADTYISSDNMYLCRIDPEGYYLDIDHIYKPCYISCKFCSGEGDVDNHKCTMCKSHYTNINETGKENNCYYECTYLYYFNSSGDYVCSDDNNCPSNFNKIIKEKGKCVDECKSDDTYQYESNNRCYSTCPEDTHYSYNNMFLCQQDPEGYFLDEFNIYKECYQSCKFCYGEGNSDNHNCISCKLNYRKINDDEKNCFNGCDYLFYIDSSNNYVCTDDNNCPPNNYNKLISEKSECIDECKNDNTYQYEYNNECFSICPGDSHYSYDNLYLCQIDPEGYFLDEHNIYKKCYETCKFCYGEGDIYNHNCIICKLNYRKIDDIGKEKNCYSECDYFYYFDSSGNYFCTGEDACPHNYNKLVIEKNKCIDDCKNDDIYQKEYNNECHNNCPSGTYLKNDNTNICYKDLEGYYLDADNIYKPCYSLCKSCNGAGDETNNNCNECISNFNLISNPKNIVNCYEKCDYYYYFNSSGYYHCTQSEVCPEVQRKLIKSKSKCIDDCSKDDVYKFEENDMCVKVLYQDGKILLCPINLPCEKNSECIETCTAEEFLQKECIINNKNNLTVQDSIIKSIKTEISKGNLSSIISNVIKGDKEDFILYDSDTIYQITSSENQNSNDYNNMSSILLGECESELKRANSIKENDALIIFKLDIKEEGLKIPVIQYEIYNPYTLEKLELDVCKDKNIDISIPVSIDEKNLFKYNSSDEYYNDICYSYTTENGTDIVVKDRQSEFKDNNMSLCESNCNYTSYNSTTKKVICNCEVKKNLTSVFDIKKSADLLLYTFSDLKNSINLEIMKCYKVLFTKKGLIQNYGSYILLFVLSVQIISFFIFIIKGYNTIYNLVHQLAINCKKKEYKNKKGKANNTNSNSNLSGNIYHTEQKRNKKRKNIKTKALSSKKMNEKIFHNPIKKKSKKHQSKIKNEDISSKNNTYSKIDLKNFEKKKISKKIKHQDLLSDNLNKNNKININNTKLTLKIFNYNDYEINNLLYEEALEIDNRKYCQYYCSLMKQKHLIIFTFYTYNDYNSRIIKICLFFFSFALHLTVNTLFFNYKTFHKIYKDSGSFNLLFQLPQIILSTIISTVINMLVKTLSLTQKDILELKNVKENHQEKEKKLMECLKIKFTLFFIISFILLLLFWYYLACFCCVYTNTQKHLIEDTSISFGLSLIYPVFINFIPGFFRISALRAENKDKEFSYKISQIIQLI